LGFTLTNAQAYSPNFPLAQKEKCNQVQLGHCQLQIGFDFFPLMALETMTLKTKRPYLAHWAPNI
jgi:hypothetical protein